MCVMYCFGSVLFIILSSGKVRPQLEVLGIRCRRALSGELFGRALRLPGGERPGLSGALFGEGFFPALVGEEDG